MPLVKAKCTNCGANLMVNTINDVQYVNFAILLLLLKMQLIIITLQATAILKQNM